MLDIFREVFMPFIIFFPSGKNLWQLFAVFFLTGIGFYFAGSSDVAEAEKYKDGPRALGVAEVNQESLLYEYVKLTGFTDGAYMYSYFQEGKDKEKIDETKAITLYYALLAPEELEVSLNNKQTQPRVFVRQILPDEQRSCIDTQEGCVGSKEITLEGRLTKKMPLEDDITFVKDLAETSLYTVDDNTIYLDVDWRPVTAESASSGKPFAIGWMVVSALLGAFTFYRSRRNKVATPTVSNASSPTQEQL
jgi:hypothetical protein